MNKSISLSMRFNPEVKKLLVKAAKQEHRSITNMIESLVINYWINKDIESKKAMKDKK